jgi:6-phosphogluconolactonase (cycloisomerase 2 family)
VTVSPDGKHVYTTSNGDSTILAFRRDSVSGKLGLIGRYTKGKDGVSGLRGARSVIVSPDGKSVYVVAESDHAIVTFSRDGATGDLTYRDHYVNDSLLHWGVDLAIHPSGKYLYAVAEISAALSAYKRDAATGGIEYFSHYRMSPEDQRGLYAAYGVAISPDGKHVYSLGWEFGSVNFYEVVDTLVASIKDRPRDPKRHRMQEKGELFTLSYSTQRIFSGYLPSVRTILVKDVRNRTVFSQPVEGNGITWSSQSMEGLPPGLYYLVFRSEKSELFCPWVKLRN